ncbi:MAG TPA: hypothetical protein VK866_17765 [Acidimicrobiales bacterium]|nr:hypothetical protein [Acidimicrobiales bacterium]
MTARPPVHLVRGDDAVLVGEAARRIIDELVGDDDRSLVVDDLEDDRYQVGDEHLVAPLVDAALTPPFLTARRVVVGRHLARFGTAESVAPLIAYLAEPLDTTDLVLVWDKGPRFTGRSALPKALLDAVKRAGGVVVATDVPGGKGRDMWLKDHLATASVHLDNRARTALVDQLGEDLNRLGAILSVLEGAYGAGARIGLAELAPFLGEAGGVPPWDLTDAIDRGDIGGSIDMVQRMLGGGDRHALQIMATLHGHVAALLALDGSGVRTKVEAAAHLGIKSEFRAGKLLAQTRVLGSDRIRDQVLLLAQADLDLRGASEWPDELILEVLVARLARTAAAR